SAGSASSRDRTRSHASRKDCSIPSIQPNCTVFVRLRQVLMFARHATGGGFHQPDFILAQPVELVNELVDLAMREPMRGGHWPEQISRPFATSFPCCEVCVHGAWRDRRWLRDAFADSPLRVAGACRGLAD